MIAMRSIFPILLACLLLPACNVIYKQPIYQGNLLEKATVDKLAIGMNRQQVYDLLGSPSVQDPFHQDRWDYVATQRVGHGNTEIKTFTIQFTNDKLSRWDGEYFAEQDAQLAAEMARFGNLPKNKKKK